MDNKNTKEKEVIRKTRKKCINEIGKEKFEFDYREEFVKYKYIRCAKMSSREWRNRENCDISNSYMSWKQKIKNKYRMYSEYELKEFLMYLESGIRDRANDMAINRIVYTAILSSTISAFFCNILSPQMKDQESVWVFLFYMALTLLLMVPLMTLVIYIILVPIRNNLQQEMFYDYQEIIREMIKEKSENDKIASKIIVH